MWNIETISVISSASIAIISIIGTVATAYINQRAAYKRKMNELFFQRKADAYQRVICIGTNFPKYPEAQNVQELYDAISTARLYSSQPTERALTWYGSKIAANSYSTAEIEMVADALEKAISAMQSEINKYEP